LFSADGPVTGHDHIDVPSRDLVARLDPLADVTVIRVRRNPEEAYVACEQNLVLRQVGHDVAPGVRRTGEFELDFRATDEIGQIVLEGHRRGHKLAFLYDF